MIYAVSPAEQASATPCADALVRRWAELIEHISSRGRLLRRSLGERIPRHGLPDSQFSILWACWNASAAGLAQTELAAELGLSPAHVSGQVDQLRDRGLLQGERGLRDRRRQVWRISEAGRSLLEQLLCEIQQELSISSELVNDPLWPDVLRLVSALVCASEGKAAIPMDRTRHDACVADGLQSAAHATAAITTAIAEKGAA